MATREGDPEETVLYQMVIERWPAFRERMEESGGLPKVRGQGFEEYLKCGNLERRLPAPRLPQLRLLGGRGALVQEARLVP